MATLADELLNDFDDSGSENDEQNLNRIAGDDTSTGPDDTLRNGPGASTPGMDFDGDEEDVANAEEELAQSAVADLQNAPDDEETKARVEKMKFGNVSDVRNVAGLMKTLQPVLEVRPSSLRSFA